MNSTIERPKLDQAMAKEYVERAAKELATWPALPCEDRADLFFGFAKSALSLFNLSDKRPFAPCSRMPSLGRYMPISAWIHHGFEIEIDGIVYDSPKEEFCGGILLLDEMFEASSAVGVIEVFAHECIHAIHGEIDTRESFLEYEDLEELSEVTNTLSRDLKERSCFDFQKIVAEEMKLIPEFSPHLPEEIGDLALPETCDICCSYRDSDYECDNCGKKCCEECFTRSLLGEDLCKICYKESHPEEEEEDESDDQAEKETDEGEGGMDLQETDRP